MNEIKETKKNSNSNQKKNKNKIVVAKFESK